MSTANQPTLKARVIVGASHAYACITTPTKSLDVQLKGGMPASKSLTATAAEMREKAQSMLDRAELLDAAAALLHGQGFETMREGVSSPA